METRTELRLIAITCVERFGMPLTIERSEWLLQRSQPGSVGIQLRDHVLPVSVRLELGRKLRALTRHYAAPFIVNDRLDLALLLEADGVHLGERSLALPVARSLFGADPKLAGGSEDHSAHSPFFTQAAHSVDSLLPGPFAWLLSPVVEPRKGRPALGLSCLSEAQKYVAGRCADPRLRPRIFALGGVRVGSAQACLEAGADGVAVQSAAWDGGAPGLLAELGISG